MDDVIRGKAATWRCGRFFQFRLRTLLITATIVCAALGAWRLYWYDLGPFVDSEPALAGQPFKVRGRLMIWGQPEEPGCDVCVGHLGGWYLCEPTIIKKTGWFEWSFEYTYSKTAARRLEPGSYDLWITTHFGGAPAARTRLIVRAPGLPPTPEASSGPRT